MITWIIIAIFAYLSGIVKGTTGFGSSLVAIPLLTIYYPIQEVVIIMITYNVILNVIVMLEHKQIITTNLKNIRLILLFGIIGTFLGLTFLGQLDELYIKIIASFLILLAILTNLVHLELPIKETKLNQILAGLFSGLGNGIASIDGPPVVLYLTSIHADKAKFKNTLATHFLVLGIFAVAYLLAFNDYQSIALFDLSYITLFAILGAFSGIYLSKFINEELFKKVVVIVLIFLVIFMYI